ncbi:hypothetical protein DQP55_15165 [Mycolicibacterium sp. GF69]|uniref:hypothetical protein n=1 Tax=Mycolicibacterium sp. GF69 TaxID=2267251 RepID=UPI000DCDA8E7|nr:hypothetical protein [Mycolicibacterium sp. GF69]RAV10638.1 hypothetical protein DQP55_15165 [Mycolicibacterium sp. GF69]
MQGSEKYNQHSLYLTDAETLSTRQDALSRFLAAVKKADAPLSDRDPEALAAVAGATGLDQQLVDEVAAEFEFSTQLGPELPGDLADRARWAQSVGRVPQDAQIPDYSTLIVSAPLDGITR